MSMRKTVLLLVLVLGASGCSFLQDWGQYQQPDDGDVGSMDATVDMRDSDVPQDDGGDSDAGPDDDGGPPADCLGDGQCDDSVPCTIDQCLEGTCSNTPEDTMCTAAADGRCEADGCQYPTCTGATCTAGPCQEAECAGDMCVRTSTCEDGEMCCGGECAAAGCDDGNPCTIDSCGATGCEHFPVDSMCDDSNPCTDDVCGATACEYTNNAATCDDGVFCNGADTCSAGSCDTHAGDPCPGASVCQEAGGICSGCASRSDCPPDIPAAFGACSYANSCSESGTRSGVATSYACVVGTCEPTETTVMDTTACGRSTESNTCAAETCGEPTGSCGGFGSTCDNSGTRARTCTRNVCRSGSCTPEDFSSPVACTRNTNGTDCGGAPSCPGYPACSGFSNVCDETGTRSRTCTQSTCSSGTCSGSRNVAQSENCSRPSTDGVDCGTESCSDGPCGGFANTCDATGTLTETCTQPECNNGSCSGSSTSTSTNACSRASRDGIVCGTESCPAFGSCIRELDSCMGSENRTCTTPVCASNSCSGSSNRRETQDCCASGSSCDPEFGGSEGRCFGCFCEPLCGGLPC
ncbi:MAG: hypothetical protein AB8I08_13500 [Sandaracinaceae bacterium]